MVVYEIAVKKINFRFNSNPMLWNKTRSTRLLELNGKTEYVVEDEVYFDKTNLKN